MGNPFPVKGGTITDEDGWKEGRKDVRNRSGVVEEMDL
jgi:hypothetical protein